MTDSEWILNRNPDGIDVLHTSPSLEVCNADQVEGRQTIDAETGEALVRIGAARPCEHCAADRFAPATATAAGPTYTAESPTLDTRGPDDR